jgi:hypothetical protein
MDPKERNGDGVYPATVSDMDDSGSTVIGDSGSDTLTVLAKLTGQLYCNDTGKAAQTLKIHNHLTTSDIGGAEYKGELINTTGSLAGVYNTWSYSPTGDTGAPDNVWGEINVMAVTTGDTVTAGNIAGTVGHVQLAGTLNGAAVTAIGVQGVLSGAGANTLVSNMAGVASSMSTGLVNPTTGQLSYWLSNSLSTVVVDNLMYALQAQYITNVLNLDAQGGCDTQAYTGNSAFAPNNKGSFTQCGQLRIVIGASTYYVPYGTVA